MADIGELDIREVAERLGDAFVLVVDDERVTVLAVEVLAVMAVSELALTSP